MTFQFKDFRRGANINIREAPEKSPDQYKNLPTKSDDNTIKPISNNNVSNANKNVPSKSTANTDFDPDTLRQNFALLQVPLLIFY